MTPRTSEAASGRSRLFWIDVFRGLAILLMVPANFAPYLADPHPTWYRVLGSFAAPMFIALSAGMVALQRGKRSFGYYAKRGGCIILIGALIDWLLTGILPFTSFDVLYVIGLSLPVAYLVRNWSVTRLWLAAIAVFLATPLLQRAIGYDPRVYQIYFGDLEWPELGRLLQSLFVDGWFPVFPWIGFALLGVGLFRIVLIGSTRRIGVRNLAPLGALAIGCGVALTFVEIPGIESFASGGVLENRNGYSDIFYPATIGYLVLACGVVLLAAAMLRHVPERPFTQLLAYLGQYSMLIYVLHTVWAAAIIRGTLAVYDLDEMESGYAFAAMTFASIVVFALACRLIDMIKTVYRPKWLPLQVVIGR
jgi:uncharacterized membrane protein